MSSKVQDQKKLRVTKKPRVLVNSKDGQIPINLMSKMLGRIDLPNHSNARFLRQTQILQKQRIFGNAHVQRLLNDLYEQENLTGGQVQETSGLRDKNVGPKQRHVESTGITDRHQVEPDSYIGYAKHIIHLEGNEVARKRGEYFNQRKSSSSITKVRTNMQLAPLKHRPTTGGGKRRPSKRARRIFQWLEAPLQKAVKDPSKIDGWTDSAVAGMVLMYNKLRNEDLWQYVKEIKDTSSKVSLDFYPRVNQTALKKKLPSHGYNDCMASWRIDWGLRKEKACGPHLHFKHFNAGDKWINVHIDKIDPCCGVVPIIGPIISGLRHLHHDLKGWSKRNPEQFLKILKKQGVPLSTGVLRYLKRKGYLVP